MSISKGFEKKLFIPNVEIKLSIFKSYPFEEYE